MNLFNRNEKSGEATLKPQAPETTQQKPAQPFQAAPAAQPQGAPLKGEILKPAEPARATPSTPSPTTTSKAGATMASVISKALKITGELESTEDIQIDGQIDGDVRGVGVKIGQNAKVKGTVYGEEVELAGSIEGKVEAKKVILAGTARMTGDVWFQDVKIESGAYINGNLKPELGKTEAGKPAHKPAATASVSPLNAGNSSAAAPAHA